MHKIASLGIEVYANPAWSPDGKHLSYTLTIPASPKDLFIVSVKTGRLKQLTYSMPPGNFEKTLVIPKKIPSPSSYGLASLPVQESYYVWRIENRRQMLNEILEFFDHFLKDKVVPQ